MDTKRMTRWGVTAGEFADAGVKFQNALMIAAKGNLSERLQSAIKLIGPELSQLLEETLTKFLTTEGLETKGGQTSMQAGFLGGATRLKDVAEVTH